MSIMKYRAEIDGLRALAVIPVVLFHAHVPGFSGGYVGVDIFFVISGYLITTILIDEIEAKQFSIVNFYDRRLRRILPALSFVVILCYPAAYFLLLPSEFLDFSQSILAVTFFASNILFFLESDYFATASELKPLLHTWSLAIEEQYYLFFPIFLMMFWRFGKTIVLSLLAFVFLVSLVMATWASTHYPSANFYLLPTRIWELLVGAGLAFFIKYIGYYRNRLVNEIGGCIGILAIIYSIIFFNSQTPFPGIYALVPTVGAACLIVFAVNNTLVQRFLGLKGIVYIGLISYSLYLWHQPVFAFSKQYTFFDTPNVTVMLILSVCVLVLAHLSWKYIETPFRSKKRFNRERIFSLSALVTVVMIFLGIVGIFSASDKSTPNFLSKYYVADLNLDNVSLREKSWEPLRTLSEDKHYQVDNNAFDKTLWFDEFDQRKKLLIIGNSHSKDIYNVLSHSNDATNHFQLARYGEQISQLNEKLFNLKNYQVTDVIMIASQYRNDSLDLDWLIERAISDKKQFIIVKNIAEFPDFYARKLTLADKIAADLINENIVVPKKIFEQINAAYSEVVFSRKRHPHIQNSNEKIDKLAQRFPQITVLDRNQYICDVAEQQCFAIDDELNKYFYDYSHHTMSGAKFYGNRVDNINWLAEVIENLSK